MQKYATAQKESSTDDLTPADEQQGSQPIRGRLLLELDDRGRLTAYRVPDRFVEIVPLENLKIRIASFKGAIFVDDAGNQRQIEDTGLLAAVVRVLNWDKCRDGN